VDIKAATERYEARLRATLPLVIEADLDFKHEQMALAPFPFLRATFYRWSERWRHCCPHLASTPVVLGVGDLHVENYGTWRDAEGRLVWGVNDFDEATLVPYAVDLVRLATSAGLAANAHDLSADLKDAAGALVAGYTEGLAGPARPFVLAERHAALRQMATSEPRDPVRFWAKMQALPEVAPDAYPPDGVRAVLAALPSDEVIDTTTRSRRAGLGSLGRPRLVALAEWRGAKVAREVKSLLPSAWDWVAGTPEPEIHYATIMDHARRCPDPFTAVRDRWLVRRLAPDCARIVLADLPAARDESTLLHAMGSELANIHRGTPDGGPQILSDLAGRHPGWLLSAAERMVADTVADWTAWRS
jgi:Uncharacterized protein conserved in bacteria (DUF2252)